MNSIIIDFQNLDFDLSKVQDKTYNEIAEKVYYKFDKYIILNSLREKIFIIKKILYQWMKWEISPKECWY